LLNEKSGRDGDLDGQEGGFAGGGTGLLEEVGRGAGEQGAAVGAAQGTGIS
jgi:hypothetical protein